MKKTKKLSKLTAEELTSKRKKTASILIFLSVLLFGASLTIVYLSVKTKNYGLTAAAIGSFSTLIPSFAYLAKIDQEINSRNLK